jgi:hypothetical protein
LIILKASASSDPMSGDHSFHFQRFALCFPRLYLRIPVLFWQVASSTVAFGNLSSPARVGHVPSTQVNVFFELPVVCVRSARSAFISAEIPSTLG